MRRQRLHQAGRVVGRRDQVEVLAGLGPAPGRTRDLDPVRHPETEEVRADLLCDREDVREEEALADAVLGDALQRGEDALLFLRAESAHPGDPALLCGLLQLGEVLDAELVVDPAGCLRPEAGHPRHLHQGRRELGLQLVRGWDAAGLDQRLDLLRERLPDRGQLGEAALIGELLDRDRALRDGAGRLPVGLHAKAVGPVELVENPQLSEGGGDLRVAHIRKLVGAAILPPCPTPPPPAPRTPGSSSRRTTRPRISSGSSAPCSSAAARLRQGPGGRRQLARRHRRDRGSARGFERGDFGAPPPPQGGARARLPGGLSRRPRRRRSADHRDGRRLLTRSRPTCRS